MVESDNDSITNYGSQGTLDPNPNVLENPHSFNHSNTWSN